MSRIKQQDKVGTTLDERNGFKKTHEFSTKVANSRKPKFLFKEDLDKQTEILKEEVCAADVGNEYIVFDEEKAEKLSRAASTAFGKLEANLDTVLNETALAMMNSGGRI